MIEYIDVYSIFYDRFFGYRKRYLIIMLLLCFWDDIFWVMKCGEFIMVIFRDFLKVFDMVDYISIEKNV